MEQALTPLSLQNDSLKLFLSSFDGDRKKFRSHLKEKLKAHGFATTDLILDLDHLPTHPDLSLSLSHCKGRGLMGWVKLPDKIGVDIEDLSRIKPHLIKRVSLESEISEAPRPELLWSAKEAVFKSHSETLNVITSVQVFDWHPLQKDSWSFKAQLTETKNTCLGTGEIRITEGHTISFFINKH